MKSRSEIEQATSVLIGEALWECGRAANMATFQFGKRKKIIDLRGDGREVGEFRLHVQCAWRIAREDRIIVASRDIYYPADYHEEKGIPEQFDWDRDPERRTKLLAALFENDTREFIARSVAGGSAGSLRITLSDQLALELFPDDSLGDEYWRFFRTGQGPHFVVTGRDTKA